MGVIPLLDLSNYDCKAGKSSVTVQIHGIVVLQLDTLAYTPLLTGHFSHA